MKMSIRITIYSLLIVVFNLVFFLTGGVDRTTAGWIAYGFCYVAIIASFMSQIYCINYKRIPENLAGIYLFSWIYSAVAFVINIVFIMTKSKSVKAVIIVNAVLLVVYLIVLFINLQVNYSTEKKIETIDAERQYVRDISNKLKMCMNISEDAAAKKAIEKAYDIVRTSALHTSDMAMEYELEVIRLAGELERYVDDQDYQNVLLIADRISKTAVKRNSVL